MPTRRLFLATLLAATSLTVDAAVAQDNGNAGGNGSGNGNGNAGGGGAGSGAGSGNGQAGSSGGAGGGNTAPAEVGAPAAPEPDAAPVTEDRTNYPSSLRLRHGNGFEEEIGGGRYEMRDNQGRRIVNRAARRSDYARLRRLMR